MFDVLSLGHAVHVAHAVRVVSEVDCHPGLVSEAVFDKAAGFHLDQICTDGCYMTARFRIERVA